MTATDPTPANWPGRESTELRRVASEAVIKCVIRGGERAEEVFVISRGASRKMH